MGTSEMAGNHAETANRTADLVIVGGGPAGCSAGVFTARYGLDTLIFDRGDSSLRSCAFLENYLGFPAGIDVETFYGLMHEHVEEAGGELRSEAVESVSRTDGQFRIQSETGEPVIAPRVVAATTLDGEYLRELDTDDAMFDQHMRYGEVHERFNGEYADATGRTPIEGLFLAGRLAGHGNHVLLAAGHGATVGREIIADIRRENGYWDEVASHRDWLRRKDDRNHDLDDDESWQRWFAYHRLPDDHDIDEERLQQIRDREIEFVKSTHLDREESARRTERAHRRLAGQLDDDILLDVIDDDRLREYVFKTKGWTRQEDG